jgi:predicted permease
VVGVTPPEFIGTWGGLATELWVPTMTQSWVGANSLEQRGNHWMNAIGRLREGVDRSAAAAELNVIASRLAASYPKTNRGMSIRLYPMWQAPSGAGKVLGPVLVVLACVVAIVLLIACANVANLLLGRALDRRKEMAIRLSLGATRGRLLRQMLTEGFLLAAAGGLGGLLVARWGAGLLMSFLPPMDVPIRLPLDVDARVILFTALVTGCAALAFAAVPALQGSRADVMTAIKEESGTLGGSRRKASLRNALVVGQVALSVVLLVAAGLFLQSLRNVRSADPGFNTTHILVAGLDLFPAGYTDGTGVQFHDRLLERVRALPGVQSAAIARRVPINFGGRSQFVIAAEGYQPAPDEEMGVEYNCVSPDYFRVMGIAVLRGRDISASDRGEAPKVVVVNETMAARFWRGQDPLQRHVRIGGEWVAVVGVVKDIAYHQIGEPQQPYMYLPLASYYRPETALQVRTAGDPALLAPGLRQAVRSIDAQLPLFDVEPMSAHMRVGLLAQRLAGTLLSLFGVLALVLATVGLFGVVNYLVGQRWRELGVRMALGATPGDILGTVLRHGLALAGIGLVLGGAAAGGLARLVAGQLHGISPADPVTFAGVAFFMLAVAALASYAPARRASRLDPLKTLRHE